MFTSAKHRGISSMKMDVKSPMFTLWILCSVFLCTCLCCVRVGRHLDCRSFTHIRGLTRNVDTVVIDNSMPSTEILYHRHTLQRIRLIVWGDRTCPIICSLATEKWIHSCFCQVSHSHSMIKKWHMS